MIVLKWIVLNNYCILTTVLLFSNTKYQNKIHKSVNFGRDYSSYICRYSKIYFIRTTKILNRNETRIWFGWCVFTVKKNSETLIEKKRTIPSVTDQEIYKRQESNHKNIVIFKMLFKRKD